MTTEYKDALAAFNSLKSLNRYCFIVNDTYIKNPEGDDSFISRNEINSILKPHGETIRRALRIADALMQEPSKSMCLAGYHHEWSGGYNRQGSHAADKYIEYTEGLYYSFGDSSTGFQAGEIWKAMRGQLLKEVDDETPKAG